MLDPMSSWEDKEGAQGGKHVPHTEGRRGPGQEEVRLGVGAHTGPSFRELRCRGCEGKVLRPQPGNTRLSAPRAEGRLPTRRSGSSQDEPGALGPRCVGPQCQPPPPSRTDAWR